MRVAHIIKTQGIAGAERHLLDLLPGLQQRGVDVRLIVLDLDIDDPNPFADAMAATGVHVKRLELRGRFIDTSMTARIAERLTAFEADIVHNHLIHAEFYGVPAAHRAGVPLVITTRHNDDPQRRRLWVNAVVRYLWARTDASVAVSQAVARYVRDVERVRPDKIRVIHHGVKLPAPEINHAQARRHLRALIGADSDALIIGMACRLLELKGIHDAIEAFALLADSFPDARLVVAGEGPYRPQLEADIKRLKLEKRVHLLGWVNDVPAFMAGLDVLLAPSHREGFGVTLLEAMAQAIPIIGSTAGAIPEIIAHEESGLLTPPRAPDSLADALRILLSDKPLRAHMGLMGQDRLERLFDAERMIDETAQLYRALLAGKRK